MVDYRDFKTEMVSLTNSSDILERLDENRDSVLRFYAEFATGTTQVQAQNALCFFLGECANESPLPSSGRMATQQNNPIDVVGNVTENQVFQIFPNPTEAAFTIKVKNGFEGSISIIDMNGRSVYQKELTVKLF